MTPLELFRQAESLGLKLEPRGDGKLRVTPADRCPPDFANVLRQHKAELLNWLSRPPCPGSKAVPPADLALSPVQPNPSSVNARRLMAFIVRQIGDEPGPLCEWCLKRETAYWDTFHWPDHVCAYAAARDAGCWQLQRDEGAVWELLQSFQEVTSLARRKRC